MTTNPVSNPLSAGTSAPDFTLSGTGGSDLTLSSFKGERQVLLAFFPLAFTGTCTTEMCAFSEDFEDFDNKDVVIVPISVDAVPSLAEFKRKHDMKVDLYSDFKREASRAYGVLRSDTFFSERAYFLIGKDGVIRWVHVEDVPSKRRENSEILAAIAEHAE